MMTIEKYQEKYPEYDIQNSIKGKFLTVHKPDFNSYLDEKYHELFTVHSTGKISIGGWWNLNLGLEELKDIISLSEWFLTNY